MELMDYEVVGIGGYNRKEIQKLINELQAQENLSLVVHKGLPWDQTLFAAALEDTLKWLQPKNVEHVIWPKEKWHELLKKSALNIFPRSIRHFGDKFEVLIDGYNTEVELQDWLLVEHFRHLPIYLKRLNFPKFEVELVRFDLMEALLKVRDMGELKPHPAYLQINPTIQVFDNQLGDLTFINGKGLYLMYVEPETEIVLFEKITETEALVLDLLAEEILFDETKLLKMISLQTWSSGFHTSDWKKLIQQLKIKGLLF